MRKKVGIVLILVCVSIIIGHSLFAGGRAESPSDQKKIVFMYPFDANSPITKWHQENVRLYKQRNPNVTIDVISSSTGDEYLTQVTTKMASGDAIDVLQGWTLARMEPFAQAGRLINLNKAFTEDPTFRAFLQDDPLEATTFNGGVYGIPLELAVEGIFYNKAIFNEVGIGLPQTYDEFIDAITKIRRAGYIPIGLGNSEPWIGTIPYMMIVERIGGLDVYERTVMQGTGSWTEEPFVLAAKELQRWISLGAFEPNVNGIPAVEGIARFQNREAAMFFMGSWSLPTFYEDLGDDLGFFNLPAIEGGLGSANHWLIIPNQAISVSAQSRFPEVAIDFVKFMFSEERQQELAKSGLIVTTKVSLLPQEVNPVQAYIIEELGRATGAMYPWDVPMGNALGTELNNATVNFYDGADPLRVLEAFQKISQFER